MSCFELPHGLAQCITAAKPWFELIVGLLGVGTFTLAAVLTWIIKKIRAENVKAGKAYDEALRDKQRAEQELRDTNRELGAVKYQLDLCQSAKSDESNELAEKLKSALRQNEQLESRLNLVVLSHFAIGTADGESAI